MTGPKGQWGGSRPGQGRPTKAPSGDSCEKTMAALKAAAKKYGKSLDNCLIEMAYGKGDFEETTDLMRFRAMELLKKWTIPERAVKVVKGQVRKELAVELPPKLPDGFGEAKH